MKDIVGYWGCSNLSELETVVSQVSHNTSAENCLQPVRFQNKNCVAAFAGWNCLNNSFNCRDGIVHKQDFCRVSFSAAGILELPNAEIKFENERLILSRDRVIFLMGKSEYFFVVD